MFGALDISVSGMVAQRTRLTAISANIANRSSYEADGLPYRARQVMLAPGDPAATTASGRALGVHVSEIEVSQAGFGYNWSPDDPKAIKSGPYAGYVAQSNVDPFVEQMNAMQATRAYEANVTAAEATKAMVTQALRLLA